MVLLHKSQFSDVHEIKFLQVNIITPFFITKVNKFYAKICRHIQPLTPYWIPYENQNLIIIVSCGATMLFEMKMTNIF
jgi:hypothetical protein